MRTSDWSSDVCSSDLAEGDLFLDLCLIQWAYDLGMRVVALERLEEQLALFEAAPAKDQAEVLHELLDRLEEDPNPIQRLGEDYSAGDITRLFREIGGRIKKEQIGTTSRRARGWQRGYVWLCVV